MCGRESRVALILKFRMLLRELEKIELGNYLHIVHCMGFLFFED
jgi:hypothetical protein